MNTSPKIPVDDLSATSSFKVPYIAAVACFMAASLVAFTFFL